APAHEGLRRQCAEVSIITREPAVLSRFRDLGKPARSSLPIPILGEPGTGKELFARAAHRLSSRASGPFVAVNMAAIPTELFESELFGHAKGSFTGAVAERKGYFEQADGGTIFLDEIGELRAPDQSKLLRVLQEKTFYRVGATRPTAVDVRVVAGSDAAVLLCLRQHGFDMQATARALQWDRSTVTQRLKGLGFRALVEAGGDRRKAALELAGDPALGRAVELKLSEYHEHLLRAVEGIDSVEAALAACRRRFKNLPE